MRLHLHLRAHDVDIARVQQQLAALRRGRKALQRLAHRGLPKREGAGDLFAVAQIAVPSSPTARERELFSQLATDSHFNPRSHFGSTREPA